MDKREFNQRKNDILPSGKEKKVEYKRIKYFSTDIPDIYRVDERGYYTTQRYESGHLSEENSTVVMEDIIKIEDGVVVDAIDVRVRPTDDIYNPEKVSFRQLGYFDVHTRNVVNTVSSKPRPGEYEHSRMYWAFLKKPTYPVEFDVTKEEWNMYDKRRTEDLQDFEEFKRSEKYKKTVKKKMSEELGRDFSHNI